MCTHKHSIQQFNVPSLFSPFQNCLFLDIWHPARCDARFTLQIFFVAFNMQQCILELFSALVYALFVSLSFAFSANNIKYINSISAFV